MAWGRRSTASARSARHRRGSSGLTWCREYVGGAAVLAGPAFAGRGLFETVFASARHSVGSLA